MTYEEIIQDLINWGKENDPDFEENKLSDGNHSFQELYDFRLMYNATLFNEWGKNYREVDLTDKNPKIDCGIVYMSKPYETHWVHKSWRHNDGEECFPDSPHKWFIVCAMLPDGLISNHYKEEHWDLFKIPEIKKSMFVFDGHTSQDVLNRLKNLNNKI